MEYNKDELLNLSMEAIPKYGVLNIKDLICFLPCSKSTFYKYFPDGSECSDCIKDVINKIKVKTKSKLRKNWEDSDNATLQMGLYKLLGDEEERERLNTSYQKSDVTSNGKGLGTSIISFVKTDEED